MTQPRPDVQVRVQFGAVAAQTRGLAGPTGAFAVPCASAVDSSRDHLPAAGDVSHAIDYVPSASLDVPGHHGDVEFSGVASGMVFDVTATQGSPVTARGTCLLACHSDGRGNPPNVTPYWAGGAWKKGDCNSCHDATPTTGDHGIHHAQGGCAVCHPAVPGSSHVNGVRDVKTSILGPKGGGMVALPPGGGGPGAPCGNRWMCNGMCHGNNGSAFHSQYCW